MPLTKTDLKAIKELISDNNEYIKDFVEYSAVQTEERLGSRIEKLEKTVDNFKKKMDREIGDIAEMNREFLSKFDNHENRIGRLELETGLAVK